MNLEDFVKELISNVVSGIVADRCGGFEVCCPSPDEVLKKRTESSFYASKKCEENAQKMINLLREHLVIYVYEDGVVVASLPTYDFDFDVYGRVDKSDVEKLKETLISLGFVKDFEDKAIDNVKFTAFCFPEGK